jgi:hypothetical protein
VFFSLSLFSKWMDGVLILFFLSSFIDFFFLSQVSTYSQD